MMGPAAQGKNTGAIPRLQQLGERLFENQGVVRMIASGVLRNANMGFGAGSDIDPGNDSLPAVGRISELISGEGFRINETEAFERVYVFRGSLTAGGSPAETAEKLEKKVSDESRSRAETFLLPCKDDESNKVVVVMLKEDLPSSEIQ